jgi:hypothetical protein
MRLVRVALLVVACGGSDDAETGDPTCEDLGVEPVGGTVAVAHDACVVSSTTPFDTLNSYLSSLTPLGQYESLVHDRCFGVEDNGTYDLVIHKRNVDTDVWTQDDATFDANGLLVWLVTSSRGTQCEDHDAECADCCAQSCCEDVPVSGSGSGVPVILRDCVLVSEQGG